MYSYSVKVRVRYSETDRMGYAYYGNYASYFEVARVEALRNAGVNYKDLEDAGILLPVLDFSIKYIRPAYYDDELTIEVVVKELPSVRIKFEYKTFNDSGLLLNTGETTLVFVDKKTGKPRPPDETIVEKLKKFIV